MTGDRYRITVLFTLVGAALGVLIAMLFFSRSSPEYGRTNIRVSAPLTAGTALAGSFVGAGLSRLSASRPRAAGWAVAAGVILLTGLLGASLGWIVGDVQSRNWVEQELLTRRATAVGGLVGSLVGLLVLAPRWFRRSSA